MKVKMIVSYAGIVEELLEEFNKDHNLDLKILKIQALDVTFVTVGSKKMTAQHVFELGIEYGIKVEKLRAEGKIL